MDFIIISVLIFIFSIIIIELCLFSYRNLGSTQRLKIKKRLRKYTFEENSLGDIIKRRKLSDIPYLDRLLKTLPVIAKFDRLLVQANAKQPLSFYILFSFLLGSVGTMACMFFLNRLQPSILVGMLVMSLPYLYLINQKTKRVEKFQSQLHEALDLIARALRAGHSFTNSLKLAAEEFDDPLGTEFAETLDEINFGVSVPVALRNLSERVDCKEVKYFIVAVIIQRDTGGNLAELIESLAHIVRERFKFEGKVRILAAEGKISAIILLAIPFLIGGYIWVTTPNFLIPLFEEKAGHIMMIASGIMMVLGSIVIKKMIKIEV